MLVHHLWTLFQEWKNTYHKATTSLQMRERKIEDAAQLIETVITGCAARVQLNWVQLMWNMKPNELLYFLIDWSRCFVLPAESVSLGLYCHWGQVTRRKYWWYYVTIIMQFSHRHTHTKRKLWRFPCGSIWAPLEVYKPWSNETATGASRYRVDPICGLYWASSIFNFSTHMNTPLVETHCSSTRIYHTQRRLWNSSTYQ